MTNETRTGAAQLREMGLSQPIPARRGLRVTGFRKPRESIGSRQRAAARREESFYGAFSQRCAAKGCELWHAYNPAFASESGWPDFVVCGNGWISFVEIKATSINTGRAGKLTVKQERWREAIERGGGEYMVFVLPDDWEAVDRWLAGKP